MACTIKADIDLDDYAFDAPDSGVSTIADNGSIPELGPKDMGLDKDTGEEPDAGFDLDTGPVPDSGPPCAWRRVNGDCDNATALTAGGHHSCALRQSGQAVCWGSNNERNLGDGNYLHSATPTTVMMSATPKNVPLTDVVQISAGLQHTCAIRAPQNEERHVVCWGRGDEGQLGDNLARRPGEVASPVFANAAGNQVLEEVIQISAGDNHTCAIVGTSERSVWCWGDNRISQSSIVGTFQDPSVEFPQQVMTGTIALRNIVDIAAGTTHTCALDDQSRIICWGLDANGQLGDGDADSSTGQTLTWSTVSSFGAVDSISAGIGHTCARKTDGEVWCWGVGDSGQIGNGQATDSKIPAFVSGLEAKAIFSGGNGSCGITEDNKTYCWGSNEFGQLGIGDQDQVLHKPSPVEITALNNQTIQTLALGLGHACALFEEGEVKCWGKNREGQLGDGFKTSSAQPVRIPGFAANEVTAVSAGAYHTCVSTTGHELKCWGQNRHGQLGNGNAETTHVPQTVRLPAGYPIMSLSAGIDHSCAVQDVSAGSNMQSTSLCWGNNAEQQLGYTTTSSESNTPLSVSGLSEFDGLVQVSAGNGFTCAHVTDHNSAVAPAIHCWGKNTDGQLGRGDTNVGMNVGFDTAAGPFANMTRPIAPSSDAWVGHNHVCARSAVSTSTGLHCWGLNADGQAGQALSQSQVLIPTEGPGSSSSLSQVDQVSASEKHTCAIHGSENVVACWGHNFYGQLGDGTTTPITNAFIDVLISMNPFDQVRALSAGKQHTCAIRDENSSDQVYCWGKNFEGTQITGQLGWDGPRQSNSPVKVDGLTGVSALSSGTAHNCAIRTSATSQTDTELVCWGDNAYGQLGIPRVQIRRNPHLVCLVQPGR